MKSVKILLVCLVVTLVITSIAYADVPKMINYQGKITRPSGALVDTTTTMVFSIYADSTGGTALWTETQTAVDVQYGVFSVLLGSVNPIPDSVFRGDARYLGVKVGNDSEMAPRKAIVSMGYAYHSGTADTACFAMPDADWTINQDTIYHLNGNVGIGTTDPQTALQIGPTFADIGEKTPKLSIYSGHPNGISLMSPGDEYWFNQIRFISDEPTTKAWTIGQLNTYYGNSANSFGWMYRIGWDYTPDNPKMALTPSAGLSLGDNYGKIDAPANGMIIEGNVGIGTTSPGAKLDVRDGRLFVGTNTFAKQTGQTGDVVLDNGTTDTPGIHFYDGSNQNFGIDVYRHAPETPRQLRFVLNMDEATAAPMMVITDSGKVGIGTVNPAYKLDVNGDINVAGSYNVKKGGVNYNHPDYVFEPDYKLMSLEKLKKYVSEHKSLPNVISAEDVKKNNGFKMDELLIQMLEKIEEQTIYIFQLEERIAELEKQQNR